MDAESLRDQFETELEWRQEELAFLKNQLNSILDDEGKNKYRKSLVLMLYSHFEGFTKIALQLYLQFINDREIELIEASANLQASALKKEFSAYDNLDRKGKIFSKPLPEDEKIHRLYRRVEFVERFDEFRNKTLTIDDDVIDTESNLWYVVLEKNLFRCGLPFDLFEEHRRDIDALVNRRNSISHGDSRSGVSKEEYERWEKKTYDVMEQMVKSLFECAVCDKFLAVNV